MRARARVCVRIYVTLDCVDDDEFEASGAMPYCEHNSSFCFKKFSLHLLLDFTGNKLHKTFNISS